MASRTTAPPTLNAACTCGRCVDGTFPSFTPAHRSTTKTQMRTKQFCNSEKNRPLHRLAPAHTPRRPTTFSRSHENLLQLPLTRLRERRHRPRGLVERRSVPCVKRRSVSVSSACAWLLATAADDAGLGKGAWPRSERSERAVRGPLRELQDSTQTAGPVSALPPHDAASHAQRRHGGQVAAVLLAVALLAGAGGAGADAANSLSSTMQKYRNLHFATVSTRDNPDLAVYRDQARAQGGALIVLGLAENREIGYGKARAKHRCRRARPRQATDPSRRAARASSEPS